MEVLIVGLGNPVKIFQKNRKKSLKMCHFLDFGLLRFCAELKFSKSSKHDFFHISASRPHFLTIFSPKLVIFQF